MAGKSLPSGVNLGTHRLRYTKDDTTGECAPHAAKSADNHRFEAKYQTCRANGRIKIISTARNTPAIAITANDRAIAMANTWRVSRPISWATA